MDITKVVLDHFKVLPILPTPENPKPAKIKPKAVVVKLGLQPVKLTFPPREDDDGGEGERGTCWFYCVPSTSGLGSKYQVCSPFLSPPHLPPFSRVESLTARFSAGEGQDHSLPGAQATDRSDEYRRGDAEHPRIDGGIPSGGISRSTSVVRGESSGEEGVGPISRLAGCNATMCGLNK